MKKIIIILCVFLLPSFGGVVGGLFAQVDAGIKVTKNRVSVRDSLANIEYPYIFPLLAQNTLKRGFHVPYPVGVMLNGVAVRQNVEISNLMVGINNHEMEPLDFVKFGDVTAHVQDINMRIDLWLFPFLNVYGIFGNAWARTDVTVVEPAQFSTSAEFSGLVYGVGAMLAGGVNNFFITLDFNSTWSNFDKMDHNVNTMILSPRVGYSIPLNDEEMNIGFWLGTSCVFIDGNTSGIYELSSLPGVPFKDVTIHYSLTKKPQSNWTMLIGTQYQLNRHWQLRTEAGVLGGRTSGLLSMNYRFGL